MLEPSVIAGEGKDGVQVVARTLAKVALGAAMGKMVGDAG